MEFEKFTLGLLFLSMFIFLSADVNRMKQQEKIELLDSWKIKLPRGSICYARIEAF